MKKWCLLIFALISITCTAHADGQIYPAKGENGKYGYINAHGEWEIDPKFDEAYEFRGNYAVISIYSEDKYCCSGLIDRTGQIILEPQYEIDGGYDGYYYGGLDTGIWVVWDENVMSGYFDIPSGYFSGIHWYGIPSPWIGRSNLFPVMDENGFGGYVERSTGRLVYDYQYDHLDPSIFNEGYTVLRRINMNDPNLCEYEGYYIADEQGNMIRLGLDANGNELMIDYASEGFHCGLTQIKICDAEEGCMIGYINTSGEVVIKPQYTEAYHFIDGVAVVENDVVMLIDTQGNMLYDAGRKALTDGYQIRIGNGYIAAPRHDDVVIMDMQCRELRSFSFTELGGRVNRLGCISDMDNLWYETEIGDIGIIDLLSLKAYPCVSAVETWYYGLWEKDSFFSEGLQAVLHPDVGHNGGYGFIDRYGNIVIDYQFDVVNDFEGLLAYVQKDNTYGYIDKNGKWVYNWQDIHLKEMHL